MTVDTHSKTQIIDDLKEIQQTLHETLVNMPEDKFFTGTETEWSPADYLKHLIISVKAFAKGLTLPHDQMEALFGKADGSKTYAELIAIYQERIDKGLRAEEVASNITPLNYRMPDNVDDIKTYLIETWNDANNRVYTGLEGWSEDDLDHYQVPHPAIGMLSLREMLFFTIHHNRIHSEDIKRGGER